MSKPFVYGMSVAGENFTDRQKETARLRLNFENGINTILISSRRTGKTSVVKKTIELMADNQDTIIVFMDIYDCRSEYDFYNKFAAAVLQQTAGKMEQWWEYAKEFLTRLSPKIAFTADPVNEYSLSLGITPATHKPEDVLNLPEVIAKKRGKNIIVCIDEFQQIGEMPESLSIQKRLRGVWQHHEHCSYCLFGSKKHLMVNLFQNRMMPFYQFGEMMFLEKIPTENWVEYIQQRFASRGKSISKEQCERICELTDNYSSYVQQLAWNVFAETDKTVTDVNMNDGLSALLAQNTPLFQQQLLGLSSYQLNFLRAIKAGIHRGFGRREVTDNYNLGSKSNISRLKTSLVEKELIEERPDGLYFADPIMVHWLQ
ncbi:MAG: ATP-binding protein [Bacteroidales bacterium]|nr:ATP-binding protein [Bacteroidales bacterium]